MKAPPQNHGILLHRMGNCDFGEEKRGEPVPLPGGASRETPKVHEDVCRVSDGKRVPLDKPCPLCEESSSDENEDTASLSSQRTPISESSLISDWPSSSFEQSAAQRSDTGCAALADGCNLRLSMKDGYVFGGWCVNVKNTSVHVSPVGAPAKLSRSRSLPAQHGRTSFQWH